MRRKIKFESKQEKAAKSNRGVVLGLIVLVVMLMAVLGWQLRRQTWDDKLGVNVAIADGEQIEILSVKPEEKKVIIYTLPKNLMIPVPGMKGTLRVGSLWKFGSDEKKAVEITKGALEMFLGVKLDGLIYLPGWKANAEANIFLRPTRTDVGLGDRIALSWMWGGVRRGDLMEKQLPVVRLERQLLPDGAEVLEMDPSRLDNVRRDFGIQDLVNEGERVIVSGSKKVERKLAVRMIEAAGGVVLSENGGEVRGVCEIKVGKDSENSALARYLRTKWGCSVKKETGTSGVVELLLGNGWNERYSTGED